MADADNQNADSNKKMFFRSKVAGLSLQVKPADTDKGEVAPHSVRFTPIASMYAGEMTKFGYLATSNKRAIQICKSDPNVTEITEEDYREMLEKADNPDEPNVKRAAL